MLGPGQVGSGRGRALSHCGRPHRTALRCAALSGPGAGPRRGAAALGGGTRPGGTGTGTCPAQARAEPIPAGMPLLVPLPLSSPLFPHAGICGDSSSGSCPPASSQVGLQRNSVSQPGTEPSALWQLLFLVIQMSRMLD